MLRNIILEELPHRQTIDGGAGRIRPGREDEASTHSGFGAEPRGQVPAPPEITPRPRPSGEPPAVWRRSCRMDEVEMSSEEGVL